MKNLLFLLFSLFLSWMITSCRPEEEIITTSADVQLIFSTDTVIFDTLLTERLSLTKGFRVYNPSTKAVNISSVKLGRGEDSDYQIIVNGKYGPEVRDEVLFGGDSLLVLVDVEIDSLNEDLPYLVKDSVIIEWNTNTADVKLVSWGQDAYFLGRTLICDEVWTADRPYVIYDTTVVDSLCTLTIEPGARILLDNKASLFIRGTLKILGDSSDHVIIRNTRFDANYLEAPGQWGGIFFLEGSQDNEVRFAEIENGTIGLRIGSPDEDPDFDLVVSHTVIRHMSVAGIMAFTSDVHAYNTLIFNCGDYTVANVAGGNYLYQYCTFVNSPNFFANEDPSVIFSDFIQLGDNSVLVADLNVSMENSIVWGSNRSELGLSVSGEANIETSLANNILRSDEEVSGNFTSLEDNYPGFSDPRAFDYSLDSVAFARGKAEASEINDDISGRLRDENPDIGAYERIDIE